MFDGEGKLDPNWGKADGSWKHTHPIPSPGFAGGHAFSRDGLNWSDWSRCFDTGVTMSSMSSGEKLWMLRRERPKLLLDTDGRPTHLFSAAVGPCHYKAGLLGCGPAATPRSSTIVVPLNVPANRGKTDDEIPRTLTSYYRTNFSVIDPAMWTIETGCYSCKAPKDPESVFECTNNSASALRPASVADGAGLTIVTTRSYSAGYGCTPAPAGGVSGHISSKQPLHFGTIRVKSRYFPGSAEQVSTAKGFIGLEDTQPGAGAITITMHGAGGVASGAPRGANWTRYMQSAVYQHGNSHDKTFSDLGPTVNAAEAFNLYEIDWSATAVTISVNGKVARRVAGAASVPQKPLFVRLHARSTEWNSMAEGAAFESYIAEFSFTPAQ